MVVWSISIVFVMPVPKLLGYREILCEINLFIVIIQMERKKNLGLIL